MKKKGLWRHPWLAADAVFYREILYIHGSPLTQCFIGGINEF